MLMQAQEGGVWLSSLGNHAQTVRDTNKSYYKKVLPGQWLHLAKNVKIRKKLSPAARVINGEIFRFRRLLNLSRRPKMKNKEIWYKVDSHAYTFEYSLRTKIFRSDSMRRKKWKKNFDQKWPQKMEIWLKLHKMSQNAEVAELKVAVLTYSLS